MKWSNPLARFVVRFRSARIAVSDTLGAGYASGPKGTRAVVVRFVARFGTAKPQPSQIRHSVFPRPALTARKGSPAGGCGRVPFRGTPPTNTPPPAIRPAVAISAPNRGPNRATDRSRTEAGHASAANTERGPDQITDTTSEMAKAKVPACRAVVAPCCLNETWRPVRGYEGSYEVSDCGRVRSVSRTMTTNGTEWEFEGRIRKLQTNHNGYLRVMLHADGKKAKRRVHHLVALAFLGPKPGEIGSQVGQWTVHHKDEDRTNNHASNLEWLLHTRNVSVSQHGGRRSATGQGFTGGHAEALLMMDIAGLAPPAELGRMFGLGEDEVYEIIRGANR